MVIFFYLVTSHTSRTTHCHEKACIKGHMLPFCKNCAMLTIVHIPICSYIYPQKKDYSPNHLYRNMSNKPKSKKRKLSRFSLYVT